eukprot:2076468-Amphidinium_carterae.1
MQKTEQVCLNKRGSPSDLPFCAVNCAISFSPRIKPKRGSIVSTTGTRRQGKLKGAKLSEQRPRASLSSAF